MNISPRFLFGIFTIVTSCAFVEAAVAAPTLEQMQQFMQKAAIPQWKNAASQMKSVRSSPPDAYAGETWAALDADTNVATGKAPLERVTTPRDGKDMFVLSTWLRWRILSENADARYSYAYASNLHYMRDSKGVFQKEAAVFFFLARLALAVDGARCVDQASPQSVGMGYETQRYIQPLMEQLSQMSKKDKAIAMLEAASIEEMRGERPMLVGLCTRGARTMLKAMTAGRQPERVTASDPRAADSLGKTYSIDVSGIEPDLLPEDQWRKKRREILDTFISNAVEAL